MHGHASVLCPIFGQPGQQKNFFDSLSSFVSILANNTPDVTIMAGILGRLAERTRTSGRLANCTYTHGRLEQRIRRFRQRLDAV
jgi:hypothetical protein